MKKAQVLQVASGILVLSVCLMIVTVPIQAALPLSALVILLLSRSNDPYAIGIVTIALVVVFGTIEIGLRLLPLDERPQYYRPHELLGRGEKGTAVRNYAPNKRIEDFRMPFGDLVALSFIKTIAEPRVVNFYTDSLGFRNKLDYTGQPLVIVGDSFVVGNGATQKDTISEVLTQVHGLATYNAGFPGSIDQYVDRVRFMQELHGNAFKSIFVVFEGNDFPCAGEGNSASSSDNASRKYYYIPGEIRHLESYRLFYGLSRRLYYTYEPPGEMNEHPAVYLDRVGRQTLGFLRNELEIVRRQAPCDWERYREHVKSVTDAIKLVVFVPTKYRVYAPLLDGVRAEELTNFQADFVQAMARDFSLPYLDLTQDLISAAREHLNDGEYVYWRDDTHWNGNGIRAAANAIAEHLKSHDLVAPGNADSLRSMEKGV